MKHRDHGIIIGICMDNISLLRSTYNKRILQRLQRQHRNDSRLTSFQENELSKISLTLMEKDPKIESLIEAARSKKLNGSQQKMVFHSCDATRHPETNINNDLGENMASQPDTVAEHPKTNKNNELGAIMPSQPNTPVIPTKAVNISYMNFTEEEYGAFVLRWMASVRPYIKRGRFYRSRKIVGSVPKDRLIGSKGHRGKRRYTSFVDHHSGFKILFYLDGVKAWMKKNPTLWAETLPEEKEQPDEKKSKFVEVISSLQIDIDDLQGRNYSLCRRRDELKQENDNLNDLVRQFVDDDVEEIQEAVKPSFWRSLMFWRPRETPKQQIPGLPMKVMIKPRKGIFYPGDDESADAMMKLSGSYSVEIKSARNPQFHRYVFKMLHLMYDMVDEEMGFDPWRRLLLIKAGYFTSVGVSDGAKEIAYLVPDSLSFENMEQEEFRVCWNNIHTVFMVKYGRSLTNKQLNEWAMM